MGFAQSDGQGRACSQFSLASPTERARAHRLVENPLSARSDTGTCETTGGRSYEFMHSNLCQTLGAAHFQYKPTYCILAVPSLLPLPCQRPPIPPSQGASTGNVCPSGEFTTRSIGELEVGGEDALCRVGQRSAFRADGGANFLVPYCTCTALFTSSAHTIRLREALRRMRANQRIVVESKVNKAPGARSVGVTLP